MPVHVCARVLMRMYACVYLYVGEFVNGYAI